MPQTPDESNRTSTTPSCSKQSHQWSTDEGTGTPASDMSVGASTPSYSARGSGNFVKRKPKRDPIEENINELTAAATSYLQKQASNTVQKDDADALFAETIIAELSALSPETKRRKKLQLMTVLFE
jgi:hypothetical protein